MRQHSPGQIVLSPARASESHPRLTQCQETRNHIEEWMEETKTMVVAGYCRVLEDGPAVCLSESAAEYGEQGEE
jgi:hypothetical protein